MNPVADLEDTINALAPRLKVCGHPLRLEILCAIERGEEFCVTELWRCLEESQPVVSQHLAVLKKHGVVDSRVERNRRIYSIEDPLIRNLVQALVRGDLEAERLLQLRG